MSTGDWTHHQHHVELESCAIRYMREEHLRIAPMLSEYQCELHRQYVERQIAAGKLGLWTKDGKPTEWQAIVRAWMEQGR